jgi:hypothetical protein
MVRLAHANGLGCESFVTHVFGVRHPIWNRDIDRSAAASTLLALSRISGVDDEVLATCTLQGIESAVGPGILPLGIYHRTRRRRGLMFCPICLADDAVPYFRRKWRLAYLASCTRHRVVLRDVCACGAAVMPHRVDLRWTLRRSESSNLHVRCWACARDFRSCSVARDPDSLFHVSQLVESALRDSFVVAGGDELHALAFFSGVRRLMEMQAYTAKRASPELFPLVDRVRALAMIGRWLQTWPFAFLRSMRALEVSYSSLCAGRKDLPYWIDRVARSELMVKKSAMQADEIAAMYRFLDSTHGEYFPPQAKAILGRSVEKERLPVQLQRRVSFETYETLLAYLDHCVAGQADRRTRAVLLADKVWIALGCVTAMPIARLASLTVADVRAMARGRAIKRARAPVTIEEARAWLRFYIADVRPLLGPMSASATAFVHVSGGRPVTPNALAARLRKHLTNARLDRLVPSFQELTRSVCVARHA